MSTNEDRSQYFSVPLTTAVNIRRLEPDHPPLDESLLESCIPAPFRLAGDIQQLDQNTSRSLRQLGELGEALVDYLTQQSRKIDILTSYILSLQDDPEYRFQTQEISAGGLSFSSDQAFAVGQAVEVKLFIPEEPLALFAFAEIADCQQQDDDFMVTIRYIALRECDEEALIRASLHIQSRWLKARNQQRS